MAAKLCFALTSLGRSFHGLVALYLTDFNRKFEVGLGRVKQFFSSEIVFIRLSY